MRLWFRDFTKPPDFFDLMFLWRYLAFRYDYGTTNVNNRTCFEFSLDDHHLSKGTFKQRKLLLTLHNFNFLDLAEKGFPYKTNNKYQVYFKDESLFRFLYQNMDWISGILKEYEFEPPINFIRGGIKIGRI